MGFLEDGVDYLVGCFELFGTQLKGSGGVDTLGE